MYRFFNFKGFADTRLNLFRPLTVLIGPNGAGKSNAIEAVELFSFIARGKSLHEIGDIGSGASLEVRGGLPSCARYGHNAFGFNFSANINFEEELHKFSYHLEVTGKPKPRISDESLKLSDDEKLLFFKSYGLKQATLAGDIAVEYNNFAPGKNPKVRVSSARSVLSQYANLASKNRHLDSCYGVTHSLATYLRASFVFDPIPKLMRAYERIGNTTLIRTGANLSSVLHGLANSDAKGKESLKRLEGWIRQLPEEPLQEIDFVTTSIGDVIFGLKSPDKSQIIDARMLSDGTLRALAVLTALETVPEGSRVVVEEFDNGVHPSRVRVITNAMSDCCARRKLNVLVTTHNPATLDALSPPQLRGVVFCVWNADTKAYQLIELDEVPRRAELLERGTLGDLVTKKIVEQYLAPKFEDDRKSEVASWLESLT